MCLAKDSSPEVHASYVYRDTWEITATHHVKLAGMGRIVAWNAVAIVWMMIRVFMWTVVAKKGAPRDTEEPYVRKNVLMELTDLSASKVVVVIVLKTRHVIL